MCKLRIESREKSISTLSTNYSIITIEYGNIDEGRLPKNMAVTRTGKNINTTKSVVYLPHRKQPSGLKGKSATDGIPFSDFFLRSAAAIREICYRKCQQNKLKRKFIVIHLRGTDRPCLREKMSPHEIIQKIKRLGVPKERSVIYLMTDLPRNSTYVQAVRNYFKPFIFGSDDVKFFSRYPFTTQPQASYITEYALLKIADGHIETYNSHLAFKEKGLLGYLVKTKKYVKSCAHNKTHNKTMKLK